MPFSKNTKRKFESKSDPQEKKAKTDASSDDDESSDGSEGALDFSPSRTKEASSPGASDEKQEKESVNPKEELNAIEVQDVAFNIDPICEVPKAKNPRPPPPGAWVQSTQDILGPDSQHAYVQRWIRMTQEKEKKNVTFSIVRNDGTREQLVSLLGLKNVFIKQLPNMPRPYVSRLVFDRKHESVALLKKVADDEYVVMGGCCYRPFYQQKFGEIAFLAISQNEQVQGYGTRLMAQTKERAKKLGLTHLLTCADNNAVNYFKKQGFSKKITLPFDLWQGYIKDYDGVTLMECKLHSKVDYLNVPAMLKAQKMCLVEKLKEISNSHIVYPGINASQKNLELSQIPGLEKVNLKAPKNAAAITRGGVPSYAERDPIALKALHQHLQHVLNQIKSHSAAWPFLEPVDPVNTGAVDYYEVIKNPMDLQTIQERLDSGKYYLTKQIFLADLKRIVDNCITYNGKSHYITDLAHTLEKFFIQKI